LDHLFGRRNARRHLVEDREGVLIGAEGGGEVDFVAGADRPIAIAGGEGSEKLLRVLLRHQARPLAAAVGAAKGQRAQLFRPGERQLLGDHPAH
jgi:hypothetical protein